MFHPGSAASAPSSGENPGTMPAVALPWAERFPLPSITISRCSEMNSDGNNIGAESQSQGIFSLPASSLARSSAISLRNSG